VPAEPVALGHGPRAPQPQEQSGKKNAATAPT